MRSDFLKHFAGTKNDAEGFGQNKSYKSRVYENNILRSLS